MPAQRTAQAWGCGSTASAAARVPGDRREESQPGPAGSRIPAATSWRGVWVPARAQVCALYGAPVSEETMRRPAGGDELPDVDEALAAALTAQGEPGVRALGLLRDARRILAGTGLERPQEIAESCLRGAADALLNLPGAPAAPVG